MDRRRFLGIALGGLVSAAAGRAEAQRGAVRLDTQPLTIRTKSGERRFTVEIARSAAEQRQGLMYRRRLAADAGMLFVHPVARDAEMWMRNTYIPLDMLFIAAGGRISRIVERTVPLSTETISSGGPVIAVLELNGGTVARLGISVGDRVVAEALGGG